MILYKNIYLSILILIFSISAFTASESFSENESALSVSEENIKGLWLRQVPSGIGGVNGKEGFLLNPDGTYEFVGIASMNALD